MMHVTPTWGYAENGDARIFELEPGERLPDGWLDAPGKWAETLPEPDDDAASAVAFSDGYLAEIIASEDKAALDAFAEEKGIKLDRRKAFASMLTDFREATSE